MSDAEPSGGVLDVDDSRHPQAMYRGLREAGPAVPVEGVGVLVVGGAQVDEVLHEPELFSSSVDAVDLQNERPLIPLQIDPPDHRKFRKLLDPLFAPKRMAAKEADIRALVHELIDGFAGEQEIDFAKRFSVPFPSRVFLTLLGLPHEELPTFLAMKDGIIRPEHVVGTAQGHPDAVAHQAATARSMYDYFEAVLDEREKAPQDDILSWFLDAEVEGHRLTRNDILDISFLFLIAGLDTVSASLDCMFAHLCEHDDLRERIVADPTTVPSVVEELLRWETPVVAVVRVATRDTEVAGCPIASGEKVIVMLGSANTDEGRTEGADRVEYDREVNRHLAFGGGIHRCLGSHLARLELRVALQAWHERIPRYRMKPGAQLVFTPGIRSVDAFPMLLG